MNKQPRPQPTEEELNRIRDKLLAPYVNRYLSDRTFFNHFFDARIDMEGARDRYHRALETGSKDALKAHREYAFHWNRAARKYKDYKVLYQRNSLRFSPLEDHGMGEFEDYAPPTKKQRV